MPEVTVIIAAYNSSPTLRCAVRSLCNQTYRDFEAWVVGDSCTDDSEQVVAGFGDPRLNWVNLPCHLGSQSGPNNEGLRRARGRYIAYLGHDDLWFPWHLENLVATIERAQADFVHSITAWIDPSGPVEAGGVPGARRSYAHRFVAPSSWLHRREVVETCGNWPEPEGQIGGIDFVFQRRAFLAGQRFAASCQLSVIKMPSPWWRTYARRDGYPQTEYLARMIDDPYHLQAQLLTDLLVRYARRHEDGPAFWRPFAVLKTRLKEWYGLDRWPVSPYLMSKQERWRQRAFRLRGLALPADTKSSGTARVSTDKIKEFSPSR